MRTMFIMRGIPGSGKTTYVNKLRELLSSTFSFSVCSADYFFTRNGVYKYEADKLAAAHNACEATANMAAKYNRDVIVIDNTNIRIVHMLPYLGIANKYGYNLVVVSTMGECDAVKCHARNVHNVPLNKVVNMFTGYEPFPGERYINEKEQHDNQNVDA